MMHPIETLCAAVVAAGLTSACTMNHMDDGDASAVGEQIQAARSEVRRHHEAAMAAPTLSELMDEADSHDTRMSEIMADMNGRMGSMMSRCSGSGMAGMHDMMGAMASEMTAHRKNMAGTPTLEDARTQCRAHTESMNGMLDDMRAGLGSVSCMQ
jgi:hypothetical protein